MDIGASQARRTRQRVAEIVARVVVGPNESVARRATTRAREPLRIDGICALVTGGASGLGKATAEALLQSGARVVVLDLPSSSGAAIVERFGSRARFAPGDVTSEQDAADAVEIALSNFGSLRVCVNCAGIEGAKRLVSREGPIPLEFFRRIVDVNLVGTLNVMRLAAAAMVRQDPIDGERGVIINTASIAAFEGQVGQIGYAASKAGVAGMTLPAARDLASLLVRVMAIAPGIFDTPMLQKLDEPTRLALAAAIPHPRRLGQPAEYARLVLHIIENQMLNGELIRLDGALRMGPR